MKVIKKSSMAGNLIVVVLFIKKLFSLFSSSIFNMIYITFTKFKFSLLKAKRVYDILPPGTRHFDIPTVLH